MTQTGYKSIEYAQALSNLGVAYFMPYSKSMWLKRVAPRYWSDLSSPWPYLFCDDWGTLHKDYEGLDRHNLAAYFVTDPLADLSPEYLAEHHSVFREWKDAYIVDLKSPEFSDAHIRNIRMAEGSGLTIQATNDTEVVHSGAWIGLYDQLIEHHNIEGILRFDHRALGDMLRVPGAWLWTAHGPDTSIISGLVFYEVGNDVYYHLGASSELGYDMRASFLLFSVAIRHFGNRGFDRMVLGSGIGDNNGLARFKAGWASYTLPTYFCGRILNQTAYDGVTSDLTGDYFPLYREGEYG